MIPSQIISLARKQSSNTGTGLVDTTDAYNMLNIILADFWKDITDNNPGYGINTWTYDLTAGTKDYNLPTPTAAATLLTSVFGVQQLVKVGVKFKSTDVNYVPVTLKYLEGMLNLPEYYALGQSLNSPVATLSGNVLSIYPTPTSTIPNGIQMIGPKLHFPLSTSTEDVEGCILVPSNYHMVIVEGLKYLFYGARGLDFEAPRMQQKAYYEAEKLRSINQMLDLMQESSPSFLPDLTYLG